MAVADRESKKDELEKQWRGAQLFIEKGPSAALEYMADAARALLFAYQSQALDGPCPPGQDGSLTVDPTLRRKQQTWKSLGAMPRDEAKRMCVEFLTTVLPEWKEWDATHGEAFRAQQQEGEANRLLRSFWSRAGAPPLSKL